MNWLIFALFFPHLKPKFIKFVSPELYLVWDGLRILSLLVIVFLFIRKKKIPSPVTLLLTALQGWICLIALIKNGTYTETFSLAVSVIAIVGLVDLYSDRMKELLASLMLNYELMVYPTLATVMMFPDAGMVYDPDYLVPIYFFNADNGFMYLCIPAVCIALLYARVRLTETNRMDGVMRSLYLVVASYACVYLQWPATAVAALAVLAVVMVVALIPGVRRAVIFPVVAAGGVTANLAIVVFRVMDTVPAVNHLIVNALQKDTTLSGRTPIWDTVFETLPGNWFAGVGTPAEGYWVIDRYMDHIHNVPLDLLMQGGVIALLLFVAVLVFIGIKMTKHNNTHSARIMSAVMAGFFIMAIPEVMRLGSIFVIFPLAYFVDKIEAVCAPAVAAVQSPETCEVVSAPPPEPCASEAETAAPPLEPCAVEATSV